MIHQPWQVGCMAWGRLVELPCARADPPFFRCARDRAHADRIAVAHPPVFPIAASTIRAASLVALRYTPPRQWPYCGETSG